MHAAFRTGSRCDLNLVFEGRLRLQARRHPAVGKAWRSLSGLRSATSAPVRLTFISRPDATGARQEYRIRRNCNDSDTTSSDDGF